MLIDESRCSKKYDEFRKDQNDPKFENPLLGNENPIFARQSFLGIMTNFDSTERAAGTLLQCKDKNLMKMDNFDE